MILFALLAFGLIVVVGVPVYRYRRNLLRARRHEERMHQLYLKSKRPRDPSISN